MFFNCFTCNVIYLSYSLADNPHEYASHWMITGFIEEGRVRGLLPNVVLFPHAYNT